MSGEKDIKRKKASLIGVRLSGSISVEAAYVTATIIFCLAFVIKSTFVMHDRILADFTLNEAIELSGHSPKSEEKTVFGEGLKLEELSEYGNKRLQGLLSQKRFDLSLESYRDNCMGSVSGKAYEKTMKDKGFKPHKLMRKLTLLEGMEK